MGKLWWMMSLCFAVNHATVTTPIGYATSVLQEQVGSLSLAILYGVTLLTALFIAPLTNATLGPKTGLFLGMLGYVIYVFAFAAATEFCEKFVVNDLGETTKKCEEAQSLQVVLAYVGSLIGGLGAGVLWTCQGAFLGQASDIISAGEGKTKVEVNGDIAGSFAFWYLVTECIAKAGFTGFLSLGIPTTQGFYMFAALAAIVTAVFGFLPAPKAAQPVGQASLCGKALGAIELWSDPKIWLLSFTNLTFGFSVAWLNGYVNANYQSDALSSVLDDPSTFLGVLGALIALVAGISSKLFALVSSDETKKMFVVALGALCFFLVGALSQVSYPNGKGPGGWGWGIVIFYVLQGLGRGVYESTNKGIFADFFPGDKAAGAFANSMIQGTGTSTFGFILGAVLKPKKGEPPLVQIVLLLFCSVLTVPALMMASCIAKRQAARDVNNQLEA